MSDIEKRGFTEEIRKQEFEDKMKLISIKYNRWFSNRVNEHSNEKPDKLENYFRIYYNSEGAIQLHIKAGLPIDIELDCRSTFRDIFMG